MKEILIYDGNFYRTVTAHNLSVWHDEYGTASVCIIPNNKESDMFFSCDVSEDNSNMLSKLIKLLYDKFLINSDYSHDYCIINEETKTVEFSDPHSNASGGKYTYKNNKWIRTPLK